MKCIQLGLTILILGCLVALGFLVVHYKEIPTPEAYYIYEYEATKQPVQTLTVDVVDAPNREIMVQCPVCGAKQWEYIPQDITEGEITCRQCSAILHWSIDNIEGDK